MRRIIVSLLIFLAVFVMILTGHGIAQSQAQPSTPDFQVLLQRPHAADRLLVKFTPGADSTLKHMPGARHLFDDWFVIPVMPTKNLAEVMTALAQRDDIQIVEPDYLVQLDEPQPVRAELPARDRAYPNDPYYSYQWHMPQVQSDAAWNINRGAGVVVAVVDSGVSRGSDLQCRTFVSPYDAITDSTGEYAAQDENGHGTHVAGTIGQCTNNNVGVTGLAPDVKIMPVRVLDESGTGSMSQIGTGIRWAADHDADVINLSLGMDCGGAPYESCRNAFVDDAIAHAVSKDIVIVAAAGNSSGSTPYYPANHPDVIAVAAVDYNRNLAPYSNRGSALSVSAPGGDLATDANGDGYPDGVLQETFNEYGVWDLFYFQGTSMASPHVAAAAALLRSYVPDATRVQVQQALEQTAIDLGSPGKDSTYGYGLIQVANALNYLKQNTEPTPTFTPTYTPTSTTAPPTHPPPGNKRVWLPIALKIWPEPTPTPTRTPTRQPSPTPSPTPGGGGEIYGWVTFNNQPAPGIKLTLRMYDNNSESTVATTYTNSQGRYAFKNIDSLPPNKRYYVRYGPNGSDDRFMFMWYGPDITSYRQGQAKHGGDFDIADVKMTSPPSGATRALPVTFQWQKRVYARDTYVFVLFDPDTRQGWRTDDLGYVGGVTITGLPSDVVYGKEYGWYPRPMNGTDSFGTPFYYRIIIFSQTANGIQLNIEHHPTSQLLINPPAKRQAQRQHTFVPNR